MTSIASTEPLDPLDPETAEKNKLKQKQKEEEEERPGCLTRFCCPTSGARKLVQQLSAEFVGTCLYVFIGGLSSMHTDLMAVACGHGLTMAMLSMCFFHVSGSHFNPAITLGMLLSGFAPVLTTVFYWLTQMAGASVGGMLLWVVLPKGEYARLAGGTVPMDLSKTGAYNEFQAIMLITVLSFILVYVYLMTFLDRNDNALAPIAVGLTILVFIFAVGNYYGDIANPARTSGPVVMYSIIGANDCPAGRTNCPSVWYMWRYQYVPWAGAMLGAALSAFFYRLLASTRDVKEE